MSEIPRRAGEAAAAEDDDVLAALALERRDLAR
jgi:hypothetical protein